LHANILDIRYFRKNFKKKDILNKNSQSGNIVLEEKQIFYIIWFNETLMS